MRQYSDNTKLMKNPLLYYILRNKRRFSIGIFFLIITNILDGVYPLILKEAIDLVASKSTDEKIQNIAILFFTIMALLAVTRYLWRRNFGQYHTDAAEDLRNRIFHHLTDMGPSFYKKNPVGEIMSILINDVQSFRNAIGQGVLVLIDGIVILSVILPLMIYLNPSWTWKTLIFIPLVPFLIQKITKVIFQSYKNQQDKLAEVSAIAQESISGIRVIKSFAQEDRRLQYYNEYSRKYEKASIQTAKWDSLFMPIMEFGITSGSVILIFVGAPDVLSGAATVGTFIAFQRYIRKMVWPMTALGMGFSQFQKGMASFQRIKDILNQSSDIPDHGQVQLSNFETLEVKNLSFQYPDGNQPVLKNLQFKVNAGEFIGIVGPVGSGKTTLLNLLTRLYETSEKTILINGHDIRNIQQKSLYRQISMVPQEAFLFSESIAENIQYGIEQTLTHAPHNNIQDYAHKVDIDKEIQELPAGYESQLGERGVNLSGGQKQRLTIARALFTEAPVVILDDSLSAVDVTTENKITKSIEGLSGNKKTRIVVAHRLSVVEKADKIIVLKDGEIETIGSHQELLIKSPTYQRLAEIQEVEG